MGGIGESQISDSDSSKYSDSEDGSDFDGDQLQEIINNGHQNSLDKKLLDAARDGKLHKVIRLLFWLSIGSRYLGNPYTIDSRQGCKD